MLVSVGQKTIIHPEMNNSGMRDSFYKVSHLYDGDSELSPTSKIAALRLSRNGQELAPRASSKSANVQQEPNWQEVDPDTDLTWSRRSEPGKKKVHRKVTTTVTTLEPADATTVTQQTFTSTGGVPGPSTQTNLNSFQMVTQTQTNIPGHVRQNGDSASPEVGLRWQNPLKYRGGEEIVERRRYGPGGDSPSGSLEKSRRKPLYESTRRSRGPNDTDITTNYAGNLGIYSTGVTDTYMSRTQEIFGQGNKPNPPNVANETSSQVTRTIINHDTNTKIETGGANIFQGQGDSFSREEQNVIDSAMFTSKVNQNTQFDINEERNRLRIEITDELRERLRREISEEFEIRRRKEIEDLRSLTEKDLRITIESQIRRELEAEYNLRLDKEAQARLNLQGDLLQKIKSEEQYRLLQEHKLAVSQIEQNLIFERNEWSRKLSESVARQENLEKAIIVLRQDNDRINQELHTQQQLVLKLQDESRRYVKTIEELSSTIRAVVAERDSLFEQLTKHEEHIDRLNLIIFLNKLELLRVGLYQRQDQNGNPLLDGMIIPRPQGPAKSLHFIHADAQTVEQLPLEEYEKSYGGAYKGMKSSYPKPGMKIELSTVNAGNTSHVHVHDKIYSEVGETLGPQKEHFTYHTPKMLSKKSENYLARMENILKRNLDNQADVCVEHMPLGFRDPYHGNVVYEQVLHKSNKSTAGVPTKTIYAPFPEQEHFYLRRQAEGLTNASAIHQNTKVRGSSLTVTRASVDNMKVSRTEQPYIREVEITNTFEPLKRVHQQLEVPEPSPRLQLDRTVFSSDWHHVHHK